MYAAAPPSRLAAGGVLKLHLASAERSLPFFRGQDSMLNKHIAKKKKKKLICKWHFYIINM